MNRAGEDPEGKGGNGKKDLFSRYESYLTTNTAVYMQG